MRTFNPITCTALFAMLLVALLVPGTAVNAQGIAAGVNASGYANVDFGGGGQPYGQYGQPWNQGNQGWWGNRGGNDTFKRIAKLALTAGGAVVAGLFGSQFGTVGTVVGGAVGFLVSRWIANKIFGSDARNYYDQNNYWSQSFPPNFDQQFNQGSQTQIPGPIYKPMESGTYGDLSTLRDNFYRAADNYTKVLATGDAQAKRRAADEYEHCRSAYFNAKGSGQ